MVIDKAKKFYKSFIKQLFLYIKEYVYIIQDLKLVYDLTSNRYSLSTLRIN